MKFYQCKDCGSIVILGESNVCCINGWEELLPNTTDAAGEKHVPVIDTDGKTVTVKVGSVEHPMLAAHYIMWIVLETNQGYQKKELKPEELPGFLKKRDFRGVNVTIPYKQAVIPYLDEMTPRARRMRPAMFSQ